MPYKMYIPHFNYHRPKSLDSAIQILNSKDDAVILAGGTDLLLEIKMGQRKHHDIISLNAIDDLKHISFQDNILSIGAAVTHSSLLASQVIKEFFPAVSDAAGTIGTEQIRNIGTIGGNLCTGASCCDTGPALLAMKASFEITGQSGKRLVPSEKFFVHHRQTVLQPGEMLTAINIPKPKKNSGSAFIKFGLRESASISVASVAVMITSKEEKCAEVRISIGAVAPTPMLSKGAMRVLSGASIQALQQDAHLLNACGKAAAEDALPIDDIRGTAEYRRQLIHTLTKRTLLKAIERIG